MIKKCLSVLISFLISLSACSESVFAEGLMVDDTTAGAGLQDPVDATAYTLRDFSSQIVSAQTLASYGSPKVGSGTSEEKTASGTTFLPSFQGKHEVSLFSGSLNYSYPLWVPRGRGDMTPGLSLSYSNLDSRYSGPVGYGWSYPMNAIYRTRKKGLDTMYSSDYYMADIFGSSEELIVIDSVNNVYAPKDEGSFNQFTFGGTYWTAKDAKGNTYTFGQNSSARQVDPDDSSRVFKWMLERVEDMNGNFMAFTYQSDGNELYPSTIRYTGFGEDAGIFEIQFHLQDRDPFYSYNTGFKVTHQKLIDEVRLISHEGESPATLLTYHLDYTKYNNAIYLLNEIGVTDGTNTLPPTQFTYFDGSENVTYKKINGLYKITQPYGGMHEFTYKPASLYREGNGSSSNLLPFTVYTVYEDKTQAETGAPVYTTTYDYRAGHYYYDYNGQDAYKREYAGFGKVTVEDPAGNIKKFYFHQSENDPNNTSDSSNGEYQDHISKKGRIYREEQYDDADNLLKTVIRKWDKETLDDDDAEFDRFHAYLARETTVDYGENDESKAKAVTYDYDEYGNPTEVIDYGEVSLTNQAGDFSDTGADKITTTIAYVYDTTARLLRFPKQTERKDNSENLIGKTKTYYDELAWGEIDEGNKTKEEIYKDANNFIANEWAYNTRGLLTSQTNPRDYSTAYTYDGVYLSPVTVANAKSQETDYEYDNFFGKPVSVTDPNGFVTETDYDGFGREVEVRVKNDSAQMRTLKETSYDFSSSPESVTETSYPDNTDNQSNTIAITKKTYLDGFGRTIQVKQEAEGSNSYVVASTVYDERGNVKKELLPDSTNTLNFESITENDPGIAYAYDALSRVKTVTTTLGATTTVYNDWETRVTDPESNYKVYLYDARGNLVEVKENLDATPASTSYDYDPNNNLLKVTDAEENEFEMTYDWLGRRLTQELLHDASEQNPNFYGFTYDDNGNVATRTDAKDQTITYTYDELDRVLTENTNEVTYGYDSGTNGIGRLTSTSFGGGTKALEYNLAGTLKKERVTIDSTNYDTQFTYDLLGNVLGVTYPDTATVNYVYNNAGQLEAVTNYVSDLDYSPSGLVSSIAYANGVTTTNTYDIQQLYRLTNRLTESGADDLQEIAYTYDSVGDITDIVDTSDTDASKSAAYVYDDLYRLTSATITNTGNSQNYTQTYTYSASGNIASKSDVGSYTYGNIHPQAVTSANGVTYVYDANGSMTGDGAWTHSWNNRNQISSSTDGTTTIAYAYDEARRRFLKDDGTTETLYINKYYDKEGATAKLHVYAGNLKIATIDGETTVFHHADHLTGSNVETDASGDVVELLDYYPYGSTRIDDKAGAYGNDYKFTGKELDEDTGLYYYGARYYNANLGRFVSVDPWSGDIKDPQSLNKYAYARNNPLSYVDSDGNIFELAFAIPPAISLLELAAAALASVAISTVIVNDIKNAPMVFPETTSEPYVESIPAITPDSKPMVYPVPSEPGLGVISDPAPPVEKPVPFVTPAYQGPTGGVCGGNMSCAVPDQHSLGPIFGEPNSTRLRWVNGEIVQGRTFDEKGNPVVDTDLTNHGNSDLHPDVPHDHKWSENPDTGKFERE